METKQFFRVGRDDTKQGLWYNQEGQFTGLIHNELNFCTNHALPMNFDPEVVGFLSVATSLEELFHWFTEEDIKRLQEHNYSVCVYTSEDYKFYERFNHMVINQKTSKLISKLII